MGKRHEFVWIGRNRWWGEYDYIVSPFEHSRLTRRQRDDGDVQFTDPANGVLLCAAAVHRVLGIRLKPGEGPVRVKFTAELVRD